MRYNDIDTISFEDYKGDTFAIKDTRPISNLETGVIIKVEENMELDEVISRSEYYGEGAEDLTYTIFDHNIEKLAENGFNISGLKKIKIPVVEEIL